MGRHKISSLVRATEDGGEAEFYADVFPALPALIEVARAAYGVLARVTTERPNIDASITSLAAMHGLAKAMDAFDLIEMMHDDQPRPLI